MWISLSLKMEKIQWWSFTACWPVKTRGTKSQSVFPEALPLLDQDKLATVCSSLFGPRLSFSPVHFMPAHFPGHQWEWDLAPWIGAGLFCSPVSSSPPISAADSLWANSFPLACGKRIVWANSAGVTGVGRFSQLVLTCASFGFFPLSINKRGVMVLHINGCIFPCSKGSLNANDSFTYTWFYLITILPFFNCAWNLLWWVSGHLY